MDALQRLQPVDFLLVVVWAGLVGWGLQTGVIRQVGMLLGVYGAAILAASLYRSGGLGLGLAFGREDLARWEFLSYVAIFWATFGVAALLMQRAYPQSRLRARFGADNVLGGAVGAAWGSLLVIALVTMMRMYVVTPWRGQELSQQGVAGQLRGAQLPPVLEVVLSPMWQAMAPWFPATVPSRLST